MTIIERAGDYGRGYEHIRWKSFQVVTDDRVAIVEMAEALFGGWRIAKVEIQGHDAWCGWSEASILHFKAGDAHARVIAPESLGDFLGKLLAAAGL